jgi:hypothetical protein
VAQGMDRNVLLELELLDHPTHGTLDAAPVHWLVGQSGMAVIASGGREQPDGVAMPLRGSSGYGLDRCQIRADRWELR